MSVATFPQEAMTWLGRLPAGWQVKPLKHVVRVNPEALSDSTDPDWRMTYADISSVSLGQGIVDAEEFAFADAPSRARRLIKAGDTLVSTVRTYLRAITAVREPPENLVASTGFAVLRPESDIDPNFLGYFATSDAFVNAVVAQSVGVSYPATNASDIVRLPIAFPNIDQQQKIAAFLDRKTAEIDTLIAKKRRLLDRLAEKRTALITRAVTKGLNPDAPMKESGIEWLGEIPAHWGVRRLKFLLEEPLKYGANEAAAFDDPSWPRFIRITDVRNDGTLRDDTFRSIPPEFAEGYLLEEGDILFARSGATVGKTFQYKSNWGEAAFAGYLIRARLMKNLNHSYYQLFFNSHPYWEWIRNIFIQSTIQNVSAEKYGSVMIPLPPSEEQDKIVDHVSTENVHLDKVSSKVNAAIQSLEEYRSALITNAVTGQIKVE